MSKRIAVLCSGGGTNLQALIDAVEAGEIDGQIVLVLANASKAFALERARKHGIPAEFVSKKQAGSDEAFNNIILQKLKDAQAELVVLAAICRFWAGRSFGLTSIGSSTSIPRSSPRSADSACMGIMFTRPCWLTARRSPARRRILWMSRSITAASSCKGACPFWKGIRRIRLPSAY